MKKLISLLFATFFAISAYSAFLKNVPVDLKQPNETVIHCFITGDEFHRRVHDKDNYTIVLNPSMGYYVYAILRGDELLPTSYIVGQIDPKSLPIRPGYDIPVTQIEEKRATVLKSSKIITGAPTKGNFNNIVISIRFSDQNPTTLKLQDYEDRFNSLEVVSLKSYYKEVSNSQLNVTSYFFPNPEDQAILEYQDSHPRAYYSLYDGVNNPIGYNNDQFERTQTLFKNAVDFVKSQIVDSGINMDANSDGFVDNVVFVLQGYSDPWGYLLWPSAGGLSSQVFIGGKQVQQYNLQLTDGLNAHAICHEFFHTLGAPDLYRYKNMDIDFPVGSWDVMGFNEMGITGAQHTTTYMKWKYGKWFDKIPEITQPGTYTLKPVSQSPYACYKIPSPFSSNEYFILEYRKKEGLLDSEIPGHYNDGLIIYRINTTIWGNAGGPPDELYVYRFDGDTARNGDISKAAYSANVGKTAFNDETFPSCFLSNGKPGGIDISNVTNADNEISFTLNVVNPLPKPRNLIATAKNGQVFLSWNSPERKGDTVIGYNVFLEGNSSPLNTTISTDTTYLTSIPGQKTEYIFKVTAKYQQGESNPVTYMFINTTNFSVLDSLSLVILYNQCGGPSWQNNDNWLKGPISTWYGVTVENGRVVNLALQPPSSGVKFGLKYTIPKEIGNLTELRQLSFPNNELTGSIPSEIGNLKRLEIIDLIGNNLTGSLPLEICNLPKLNTLNLRENQLSGFIPAQIGNLGNLVYLLFRENKFLGNIPKEIGNIQSLQEVDLASNELTGVIPSHLLSLKNLKRLFLDGNKLTGQLPIELSNLKQLTTLSLQQNNFSGKVPEEILQLSNLEILNISDNNFSGAIPEGIYQLTKLYSLNLAVNNLTGTISPKIGNLKKLVFLYLQNNNFSGSLPKEFGQLINLGSIWISNNQFSGEIPSEIGNLTKLNHFIISRNNFSGSIPKKFELFSNIYYISLEHNNLEGFPDLSRLKKITYLDMTYNKFTFEDIEPNKNIVLVPGMGFVYLNQAKIGNEETIIAPINRPYTLSIYCGGKNNRYQWFKDELPISKVQTSPDFIVDPIVSGNNGDFICHVTNTIVPDLLLVSYPITLIGANTLIANAGNDFGVDEGSLVTLDGTSSYNPDGNPLTYKWIAPTGIALNSTTAAKPTFTAPQVSANTTYTFTLIVNDGTVDSPASQLVIEVRNVNEPPNADAGVDKPVNERTTVSLDGSASSDPDGNTLTYKWTVPFGITLSSTTDVKPTFTAPEVKKDSIISFYLTVNDGMERSILDTVKITVLNLINVGNSEMPTPVFKIYPNPTTGIITLELNQNSGWKTEVSVSNLIGGEVFRKEFANTANYQVDLSNQTSGVYIIKVVIDNQLYNNKIVLRKQ
jgi:M6 family metalloprotease-like protein